MLLITILLQLMCQPAWPADAPPGFETCNLEHWRDLELEAQLIRAHSVVAKRSGKVLEIHLKTGKSLKLEDPAEPVAPGPIYRVIQIDPKERWLTIFEPSAESMTYQIVRLNSGATQDLQGCPIWSPDQKYIAALHEDLESGITENEVSLWHCADPDSRCTRIWKPKASEKTGGRGARWIGDQVELLLSRSLQTPKGEFEEQQSVVSCKPKSAKANCSVLNAWKKR